MKNLLAIFLGLISLLSSAQKVELGISAGLANYTGDIAPTLVLAETKPMLGVFARFNLNHTWAFTASAARMRVSGTDANFDFNRYRNITFRTDITEISGVFEFNYFKYGAGVLDKRFTPYLYWGLGIALFNPQGLYNKEWYDLRDYRTEGQKSAYNQYTVIMPMGLGLKWMPSNKMSLEWQLGLRKAYTDYLDDVSTVYPDMQQQLNKGEVAAALTDPSILINDNGIPNRSGYQRGNPDNKDWYYNTSVSVTYRIFTRIKCARFY